ncbi:MAG: glycosyltransferase family 2 protein [Actinomycetota bacterium]|nr:glycosyltransferase family 2 protein [Actinomycetota bacterium]
MPDARPRVGVAVLNYQGARDTIECLASLRTLSTPVRIIVVDNGSDDGSVGEIAAAAPSAELVVNASNLGFGAGNNVAIERFLVDEAIEYVWLLNNDTTVEPDTLDTMVAAADSHPLVGTVGSVIYYADRRGDVQTWGGGGYSTRTGRTRDAVSSVDRVDYITAASALLRVEALRDVGLFDSRFFFLYEDVDLGVRLHQRGWRVVVAAKSRVWHKGGGTSPALSPFRMEQHAAGLVVFLRKHSRTALLGSLPMLAHYTWLSIRRRDMSIVRAAWRGWRRGWTQ